MFRSQLNRAAIVLRSATAAVFLLALSAVALGFGFLLTLALLSATLVAGLFSPKRANSRGGAQDSVIDLNRADYTNLSH